MSTKVIGAHGVSNTCSFNVFELNDESLIGGYNKQSASECNEYPIEYGYFVDDELIDGNDGECEAYITVDDIVIRLSEIERV